MSMERNAIITGANRGIGNAIMRIFAENHINMWCMVRNPQDMAFQTQVQELQKNNSIWIHPVQVELLDRDSIRGAIQTITSEKKTINILVNNAGVNHRGAFLTTPISEMERLYQINYYAPLQIIQSVAKRMIRNGGGNIINIGSVSGFEHNVGNFSYAATKASLMWATQTLSRELAPYNIRVNGIAPGVTDTKINEGNEEVLREEVLSRMNIARSGTPEEIANAVFWLASEQSSFVSGQIIRVDGGRF